MTALLNLHNVTKKFGGLVALNDITAQFERGQVVGLIGPNGAGKTTLVNAITGVAHPTSGRVEFEGRDITGLRPDQVARAGIARTFQIVQPFPRLSVLENVAAASLFGAGSASRAEAEKRAAEHLRFCGLDRQAHLPAGSLTLAGRKRLELAKSLALEPKLLLLDEVNAGLNSSEIDEALKLIESIAARGITIILIEHLMKVVSRSCSRLLVLHHGQLVADGPTADVMQDERVIEAYLGKRYAALQKGAGI